MSRCLITGANGLLGKHLVDRLIQNGHDITLLLRNPECSNKKLLIDRWHHQTTTVQHGELNANIRIWNGDITKTNLGVDAELTLTDFDHIYHLAAIYDLGADETLTLDTNVGGTERLLKKLDDDNFGGCLHFVSSIAVAGDFQGEFSERMFTESQKHDHVYNRSKYLSEKLVRNKRSTQDHYDIRIYRPSAIVGDSKTGEMDRIDGPYYGFVAIAAMKKILPSWLPLVAPKSKTLMDMVPVNYVAEAIYTLSMIERTALPDGLFCFHLTDPHAPTMTKAFKLILKAADGPQIQFTFSTSLVKAYLSLIKQASNLKSVEMVKNGLLSSLNIPPEIFGAMMPNVRFVAGETTRLLKKRGVILPTFDTYVDTLWDYYNRHLDPEKTKEERSRLAFQGKVVLITGGSGGIGFASAKRCVAYGAKVILVARNHEKLDKALLELTPIAKKSGGTIGMHCCNIANLDECDDLVTYILKQYGYVDILFNNAGLSIRRSISKSLERFHDFERTMQTNYFGPLRIIFGLLPSMVERKSGHILYSSTMGTLAPTPRFGAYVASKSAMDALSDSLAAEYTDRNIHLTSIKFPLVKTEMLAPTNDYDDLPAASPEFAAQMFVDAVLNKPRKQMTGTGVMIGISNILTPKVMTQLYNYAYKIWPDDKGDFPEMDLDRSIIKKLIPATPI
ncbi:MAG: SDR family oxidoreductase [Deltaproteobacteria bacterium]|nr:SDR family oxidoreductase [Deltaproteobacteria bacterium]